MIMKRHTFHIAFIASFIISLFIYKDSFSSYFFQDDWFSFIISRADSIGDLVNFFKPRNDVIYYRPLGIQIPFFLMQTIFGLSPLPYRLLTWGTLLAASVLVYMIIDDTLQHKVAALYAAFLYATSAVHYIPMYWFATFAFVLGPLLIFLSIWFFHKHTIYSILFHMAALLTFEIALVTPILLILTATLKRKKVSIMPLLPFVILSVSYIVFRMLLNPVPTRGDYQLVFDASVLNNLRGYALWSLNWPEELKAQMVSFFRFNQLYISEFSAYFYPFVVGLFAAVLAFVTWAVLTGAKKIPISTIAAGGIWFTSSLLPVLFFPKHAFPYYLAVGLVGLLLAQAALVKGAIAAKGPKEVWAKITLVIFGIAWLWMAQRTSSLNKKIHWAPRRAQIARSIVEKTIRKGLSDNTYHVIQNDEYRLALNDQDAMKVLFGEDAVTIYGSSPESL